MKIEIGAFELFAGGQDSPEYLRISREDSVEPSGPVGAANGRVFNRGGRITRIECQKTKEHATVAAAELYLLEHPDEVPTTGDVTITSETVGMTAGTEKILKNATVHAFESEQIGCSTIFRYTITGGALGDPA